LIPFAFLLPFIVAMQDETDEPPRARDRELKSPGPRGMRRAVYRRNVLFVTTLATLVFVFLGAVPFADSLATRPLAFALFWGGCFVLAAFILALALYDLARVRREHRLRSRELEQELARAAAEARDLARRIKEEEKTDPGEEPG